MDTREAEDMWALLEVEDMWVSLEVELKGKQDILSVVLKLLLGAHPQIELMSFLLVPQPQILQL